MRTAPITRALRKSELVEYKVLTRYNNKKVATYQDGWQLVDYNSYVSVSHSGLTIYDGVALEQWAQQVVAVLKDADIDAEIIYIQKQPTIGAVKTYLTDIRIAGGKEN